MSPHAETTPTTSPAPPIRDRFPHAPPDVTANRARLHRVARRDPTAILGVLELWLGPQIEGDRDGLDR